MSDAASKTTVSVWFRLAGIASEAVVAPESALAAAKDLHDAGGDVFGIDVYEAGIGLVFGWEVA